MNRKALSISVNAAILACLGASTGVVAQDSGVMMLEEVMVTAQRRAEGLSDVPLSISAVSGDVLQNMGVTRFDDLQGLVPNLHINEGVAAPAIVIRGFGSGAANFGFEQAVGMFVDGAYIGRSRILATPLFDVERVEVVRGPQGSLFGKNTVAGAVSITTAQPTDQFEGRLAGGYEVEYDGNFAELILSGPLSDRLRGRVAARSATQGGYMTSVARGGDEPERTSSVLRGNLAFDASENVEALLKVEANKVEIDGMLFQVFEAGPFAALPDSRNEFVLDDRRSGGLDSEYDDTESTNVTFAINWDVAGHTFNSITAFQELEASKFLDLTATIPSYTTNFIAEDFDQISQEFRLLSPTGQKLEYTVGLLYVENDLSTRQTFTARPRLLGIPGVAPFNGETNRSFDQNSESWSAYVSGTFNLTDSVRVIAGLRYVDETKEARAWHNATPQDPSTPPPEVPPTWIDFDVTDERSEDEVTASLQLQWDVTNALMGYFSFSQGHKGGGFVSNESTLGFQIATAAPGENPFQFEDEFADSFEVGLKATLFGGRGAWNAAVFLTDFENLQVSTFNGSGLDTGNAAEARSQGFETDLKFLISENLTLSAAYAYLDSTYTSYPDAFACRPDTVDPDCMPGGDGRVDLDGEPLIRAPRWEGNIMLDYSRPVSSTLEVGANIMVSHKDEFYHQPDLDELDKTDAYTRVGARVSVGSLDGRWNVALVGRNLTDEVIKNWSFDAPFAPGAHAGTIEPLRTVSLEGTLSF